MDADKIPEVILIYRKKLTNMDVRKEPYSHKMKLPFGFNNLRILALQHCHNMLVTMEELVDAGRIDKAFRWLGFVQGVLWTLRIYTLDELKNHSRPTE